MCIRDSINALRKALKLIPQNSTVLVPNNIFPHLYKNFKAYPSLIPGKNGYPLLLDKVILKNISKIIVGSKNNHMYFHGYIYNISIKTYSYHQVIYINKYFRNHTLIYNLDRNLCNFSEIHISIVFKPSISNISECIMYCNAFMIGITQEKAPVLTIFPINRDKICVIVPYKLMENRIYNLTFYINSTHTRSLIDDQHILTIRIGKKLIGWIVGNVDYVLTDTVSAYANFRIGICPIIISSKKYGLYAAGDGIMLFKKNYKGPVISLSQGNYTIEFYDSIVPMDKPVLVMNMSKIEWKKWFWPIIPYAYKYNITRIEYNVSIEGVLQYSFVNPAPKVFYTNNIVDKYSAIIRGAIKIDEKGVYRINVKTAYPSIAEVYIDEKRVEDKVYLNAGYHELKIIWNNIIISYLKFQLKKS